MGYFLTNSKPKEDDYMNIDIKSIYDSKRKGYVDFFGSIKLETKTFKMSIVSDFIKKDMPINIYNDGKLFISINENLSQFKYYNEKKSELFDIEIPYQSKLTSSYFRSFISSSLDLISLKESFKIHKKFIESFEKAIKEYRIDDERSYFLTWRY